MKKSLILLRTKKKYKQSSFIRFINKDFIKPLPLKDNRFDLLLSLFAGGISRACKNYLKIDGIVLTNNHHLDASEAARDDEYELIASVINKKDAYTISEKRPGDDVIPLKNPSAKKTYLKNSTLGLVYTDNEDYSLFKKIFTRIGSKTCPSNQASS